MSDIFISYAREDRPKGETLARALEAQGWSVWWDRAIPAGRAFDEVIDEALDAARHVIVLWSKESVSSRFVRAEAEEGARRDILIPVLIEQTKIPIAFRQIHTADLTGWDGDPAAPEFRQVVTDLAGILGPPPPRLAPPKPKIPWKMIAVVAALIAAGWLIVKLWSSAEPSTKPSTDSSKESSTAGPSAQPGTLPEMVVIPGDSFMMGSPDDEEGRGDEEGPQHQVEIARFALGKYEVTRREFAAAGLEASDCASFTQAETHPVVCVSWNDAKKYVAWLSTQTVHEYRLPTEAEWEYAARARKGTARYWGDDPKDACLYANVADQTLKETKLYRTWATHECKDGHLYTAPAGSFDANEFDLYDMLGNVREWTEDCSNGNYSRAPEDGSAWTTGNCAARVVRGGSWNDRPSNVRAASREGFMPTDRKNNVGFRVARTLQ